MSKRQNTLLSYFARSPVVEKKRPKEETGSETTPDNQSESNKDTEELIKKDVETPKTPKSKKKLQECNGNGTEKLKDSKNGTKNVKRAAKRKLTVSAGSRELEESLKENTKKRRVSKTSGTDKIAEASDFGRPKPEESSDDLEEDDEDDFSESEDEYKPHTEEDEDSEAESDSVGLSPSPDVSLEHSDSDDVIKPKKTKIEKKQLSSFTNAKDSTLTFMAKLKTMQESANISSSKVKGNNEDIESTVSAEDEITVWPHQKLEFLQPDKIKDKHKRRPDHPDYDPSTLYVPQSFLDALSPGVRQWWDLKSDNFDCVLFFKVGKFYELYHMDADVGVNELGFTYMRSEFAHSGFPEVSYDKMASILIDRGYKIARVEQTETPKMMAERCKLIKCTKFDKVVRREICQITNKGTQVFGLQSQITHKHEPNYMLAVVEKIGKSTSTYGICYIDTSIGDFYIGEFVDDQNTSRLLTLISHHMPVLILFDKKSLSDRTQQVFRSVLGNTLKETLTSNVVNKWTAENTLKYLAENHFAKSGDDKWPLVFRTMQAENDYLGLIPHNDYALALNAFGICLSYIIKCRLEEKVMPMARFHMYIPPDKFDFAEKVELIKEEKLAYSNMVLDAATLCGLRVIGEECSLLQTLDNCCTKFGKRLLHHWVCSPSCNLDEITSRQQAISYFLDNHTVLQDLRALLAPMPDFERSLAQMHLFGNKLVMQSHPDGRAILFEEKLYNKKKIQNFVSILKGFEKLLIIPSIFAGCKTPLIKRLTHFPTDGGALSDISDLLTFFKNAFNHEETAETGVIAPKKGVDAEYDEIELEIKCINDKLKSYLVEKEKEFGCRLSYFGKDKNRFQLEIPEKYTNKAGSAYRLESQRKGKDPCKRYSTAETRKFLDQMQMVEDRRSSIQKDLLRRIFEKFSNHYAVWKQFVDCVAYLDVLGSLAEYASKQNVLCIPELENPKVGEQPFIELDESYHPCMSFDTYIPNSIEIGTAAYAPVCLLTGPNMGGKSTLMRQVGLLIIMAQIGSHIPAKRCRFSLVDRIFTRLGARDDILAGLSTFLVELNETSLILKHATNHSLVLLDELGRGTATYDGMAIAASVVHFLADVKCRTLFSTHYHNLIEYFHNDNRIILGHMACMVESEDIDDPTQETVTFLYKYTDGSCPKSYGFNAAKLAGIPMPIIKRAYELSKNMEKMTLTRKIDTAIALAKDRKESGKNIDEDIKNIQTLLLQLKACKI